MIRQTLAQTTLACLLALATVLTAAAVTAQGPPVLGSGDTAIAIDADGRVANGRYPGGENPPKALDGTVGSKYLNFGGRGSGFIVTPSSPTPVESFQIRTGNDASGRDPESFELWGFNGALTTVDSGPDPAVNAPGTAEAWTLIDAGTFTLPVTRGTLGPVVDVNSGGVGYQHYKMLFPDLRSPNTIMQIDEIQFYSDEAATAAILAGANPIIAVDNGWDSAHPDAESPAQAIDYSIGGPMNLPNTKYLNFGKANSGLIFTNAEGPVQLMNMSLTTANDWADRDPASFMLWGTNDPIQSANNSDGNGGESWTLIASGPLSLPGDVALDDFRGVTAVVPIDATTAYSSYKLVFPTLKSAGTTDSMQIADVQLHAVPEPATFVLAGASVLMGVGLRRRG